ncbi:translocation/assembly module TamB domain-containing protein [Pontivivens ytuae]|uniref:Translocation/assembly module TamB domain-containing protein n=1 Tax=Pontivivens ytuae TaxID=2789856 RepID=A0A7S9LNF4_9RHOB|nr:translocation/assembly module TamB domain-containing protein [Pontivivens ytuae]QPH52336.1 translocation/assembly module TamB domain-containing protein [Pontivivens ytuae]
MRILLALLLWLCTATATMAQTSIFDIDNRLVQFALRQISSPGSFEITAELVEDAEGATRLNGVAISDGVGVWMTIDQLVVDWNSSRILRGELELNNIIVRGLDMTRAPSPNAEAPTVEVEATQGTPSPFDWPRAPIPVRVENMELTDIRIGPAVLGQEITFDGQGDAADEGDTQRVELTITRTDEVDGRIALSYLRDFAARTLALNLDAQEDAGGIVAQLAGFPEDSASSLTLSGEGPRDDWRLTFDAETDDVFEAEGRATVSYAEPLGVTADFSLEPGPELDPTIRAVVGERADLAVRIQQGNDGIIRVDELELDSPALQLTGDGTFDTATQASDLSVALTGTGQLSALVAGISFESFGFEGRVTGPPEDLTATGDAELNAFRSAAFDATQLALDIDLRRIGERLTLDAAGTGRGLRIDQVEEDTLGTAQLAIQMVQEGDRIDLATARLDSPLLSLDAEGFLETDFENADLRFDVNARDLSQIGNAYGQEVQGAVQASGFVRRQEGVTDGLISAAVRDVRSAPVDLDALSLTVELGQQGEDVGATLAGQATGLRLDRLGPEILGQAGIGADIVIGAEEITARDIRLDSDLLDVLAEVVQERANGGLRFSYAVETADAGPVAAAYGLDAEGRVQASGEGSLTDGVIATTLDLVAQELRYNDLAAAERLELAANLVGGDTIDLTARATATGVQADQLGPQELGRVTLTADAQLDGQTLALSPLTLETGLGTVRLSGTATTDTSNADLSLQLDLPQVAPIAAAYGQQARGSADLDGTLIRTDGDTLITLDGTVADAAYGELVDLGRLTLDAEVAQDTEETRLDLDGRATGLRIDRLTPDLLGPTTLGATIRLADVIEVQRAEIDNRLLTGNASGTLSETSSIDYRLAVPTLAPIAELYDQAASGALVADGVVTLADAPQIQGRLSLEDFTFTGQRFGDVVLGHDVTLGDPITAEANLRAVAGPLAGTDLDLVARYGGETLNISRLSGSLAGQRIDGRADVNLAAPSVDGRLDITVTSLSRIEALAGTNLGLSGRANARLDLSAPGERQDVALTANFTGTASGAEIDGARLTANIRDALGAPRINAAFATEAIRRDTLEIGFVDIQANGPLDGLTLAADISGTLGERIVTLDTRALIAAQPGRTRIDIDQLAATLGTTAIALAGPMDVTIANGVTSVDNISILVPGGGNLSGNVDLRGGGLVGRLFAADVDLGGFAELTGAPFVAGDLNAELIFDTRAASASASLDGALTDFIASDVLEEGISVNAALAAEWDGRIVDADITVVGGFGEPFLLAADVPLTARTPGPIPTLVRDAPLEASIRWAGEVRPLWAFVPLRSQVLSGRSTIDLDVTGTIDEPQIGGVISLSDGRYENLRAGVILTEVTITSDITDLGNLEVLLQASDGGDGRIYGEIDLNNTTGPFIVDGLIEAEEAVIVRRDDVTAQITAQIDIDGPFNDLLISGEAEVDRAEIRLVNASPPEIITLGEVEIIGRRPPPERTPAARNIDLDIDVTANNGIFVRGRGLESEWQMNLNVFGTADRTRVRGTVERLRGSFSLIGRDFDLTTGEITFNGAHPIDPQLEIILTREDDELTGQILITGPASDPQINFASVPALPEEEVLPQLLFGQSQASLNAGQALQLASGVATLASGNAGPLDVARGALGVDVLQVDAGEGGEGSSLTVGRTVGDGVFVGAETALDGSGQNNIVVELEVIRNITLDAEVAAGEGSSSIGITYSRDF